MRRIAAATGSHQRAVRRVRSATCPRATARTGTATWTLPRSARSSEKRSGSIRTRLRRSSAATSGPSTTTCQVIRAKRRAGRPTRRAKGRGYVGDADALPSCSVESARSWFPEFGMGHSLARARRSPGARRPVPRGRPKGRKKEAGRPGTGGRFRGGRKDRNVARPGGFGAGDRPIGEEIQSPSGSGVREGTTRSKLGRPRPGVTHSPLWAGCISHLGRTYDRGCAEDRPRGPLSSTSHTFFTRSAARARQRRQMRANASSMMSRPSFSRSSPITSGGRKRSTLP